MPRPGQRPWRKGRRHRSDSGRASDWPGSRRGAQLQNSRAYGGVQRPRGPAIHEAVVGVALRFQGSYPVQLPEQNGGKQVIGRKRIVWVFFYENLEPPDRAVIILVIEVVKGPLHDRVAVGLEKARCGGVPLPGLSRGNGNHHQQSARSRRTDCLVVTSE